MMKKFLAISLAAIMTLSLVACGEPQSSTTSKGATNYKLGMGIVVADSTKEGTAQIDATVAVVITDESGKITSCYLDVAQTKASIEAGEIQDAASIDARTKQEKGDDYNMKTYGGAIAEWYEQADFFANYVVGKTAGEVAAIELTEGTEGHMIATDSAILAGCTISLPAFKEAIAKACADPYAKTFSGTAPKAGLGVSTSLDAKSCSATADEEGSANIYSYYGAVAVDASGNVLAALLDGSQPKIAFDTTGNETTFSFNGTKKELGDNYGMVAYGGAIAEWYDQAGAFEKYAVGKNADGIAAIAETDDGHASDADLVASCTISITTFKEVLAKAAKNAK